MCNLYSHRKPREELRGLFKISGNRIGEISDQPAIFPRGIAPVIRSDLRTTGGMRLGIAQQWFIDARDVLPFRRTIALKEAARVARDRTLFGRAADAAEALSERRPLSWYATALGMEKPMHDAKFPEPLRLYGRRYDSNRRVEIPMHERRSANIDDDGPVLKAFEAKPLYTDLEILRHEMNKRVRYLKQMGKRVC